jgi:hypothetical protein
MGWGPELIDAALGLGIVEGPEGELEDDRILLVLQHGLHRPAGRAEID